MNRRERVAIAFPPLVLRIALAVVFIWAGSAKVFTDFEVKGADAAMLANMGLTIPNAKKTGNGAAAPSSTPTPPVTPANSPAPTTPGTSPTDHPLPTPETKPGAAAKPPASTTRADASSPRHTPTLYPIRDPLVLAQTTTTPSVGGPTGTFRAEDFPDASKVTSVYSIALMLKKCSVETEKGKGTLWPATLADGAMPLYLAWAVALTELVGGIMLLVGMLTRIWSFGLCGVMLGAMWLTEIGPAVVSGNTMYGILPAGRPTFGMEWQTLFMQFICFMMAFALLFSGPGVLSIDRALFRSGGGNQGGGGKPRASKDDEE